MPAITRDPSSGLVRDDLPDGPEATVDIWERERAAEQFYFGNIGLIGMLMTSFKQVGAALASRSSYVTETTW